MELRSVGTGGVADHKIHAPPRHVNYHVKFGSSATKGVPTHKPQTLGSAGTRPPWGGSLTDP